MTNTNIIGDNGERFAAIRLAQGQLFDVIQLGGKVPAFDLICQINDVISKRPNLGPRFGHLLEEIDKFQLSSGHDVSYMIAYFIWKHISKEKTDKEEIEMLLRASYTSDSFQKTALYYDLAGWCADNDMIILK